MMKRIRVMILSLIIVLGATAFVFAAPKIDIVTNGGNASFSAGSVVVVSGKITNSDLPMADTDIFIQVSDSKGAALLYSNVKSNSKGYYRTIFTLPSAVANGDYKVKVSGANVAEETTFKVPGSANELTLLGTYPKSSTGNETDVVSVGTGSFALVFNSNVNYFMNKNYSDFEIGKNENNVDSISLYKGNSSKPIGATVELIQSDSQNSSFKYYDTSNTLLDTERKRVALITPTEGLLANTVYKVKISADLCANNGNKLGKDLEVTFKTGEAAAGSASNTKPVVATIPQGKVVKATEVGSVINNGSKAIVEVKADKVSELIKNKENTALMLDITGISNSAEAEKGVTLSKDTLGLLIQEKKSLVIQNEKLTLVIPPEALVAGKDITFSSKLLDKQTLPDAPAGLSGQNGYEFNAQSGTNSASTFSNPLNVWLPIPDGIKNPELLGIYYLNETTKSWEYVGGRIVDNKLVFNTSHFSKYMVAESTKTFADITNHWAKKEIEVMIARNIVKGVDDSHYAPQSNITRAQFAALLSRVLKLTDSTNAASFTDVASGSWYANDVNMAAKAGITLGSDQKFRPNDNITRQEMAVMIMRAYKHGGGTIGSQQELTFTDKAQIGSWAAEDVKGVYSLGIIKGNTDGSFGAVKNASRAESAVMLKSLMDKLGI